MFKFRTTTGEKLPKQKEETDTFSWDSTSSEEEGDSGEVRAYLQGDTFGFVKASELILNPTLQSPSSEYLIEDSDFK